MSDSPTVVRVAIPLPPKELSPNARVHHLTKARKVKQFRETAWAETLRVPFKNLPGMARGEHGWQSATAQAVFYHADKKRRDADNLLASLKPAFDGLVDAGLLADDKDLMHLPVQQRIDKEEPRVELFVAKGHRTAIEAD